MAQNPVALVTGAGSGIGRATALALAKAGWTTVLTGRRREALEETASRVDGNGETLVLPCDVSDAAAVETLFAAIERDRKSVV